MRGKARYNTTELILFFKLAQSGEKMPRIATVTLAPFLCALGSGHIAASETRAFALATIFTTFYLVFSWCRNDILPAWMSAIREAEGGSPMRWPYPDGLARSPLEVRTRRIFNDKTALPLVLPERPTTFHGLMSERTTLKKLAADMASAIDQRSAPMDKILLLLSSAVLASSPGAAVGVAIGAVFAAHVPRDIIRRTSFSCAMQAGVAWERLFGRNHLETTHFSGGGLPILGYYAMLLMAILPGLTATIDAIATAMMFLTMIIVLKIIGDTATPDAEAHLMSDHLTPISGDADTDLEIELRSQEGEALFHALVPL